MSKKFRLFSIAFSLVFVSYPLLGKTVVFDRNPKSILLQYGKPTIFRFESKVRTVSNAESFEVKPANEEAPDYSVLTVMPRTTSAAGTVIFILSDGSVAKLQLKTKPVAGSKPLDNFYDLKAAEELYVNNVDPRADRSQDADGKMGLMRALILGSSIRGYEIRSVSKPITTGVSGIEASLERIYKGADFNGYVFKIVNHTQGKKFKIDIRRLNLGNPNLALLSQVDRSTIHPARSGKNIAYLTIVAMPGAHNSDVLLPVASVPVERSSGK